MLFYPVEQDMQPAVTRASQSWNSHAFDEQSA